MSAQTWTSIQTTCAVACGEQLPSTNFSAFFNTQFPQAVSYAEGRISTEIPLLNNRQEHVQGNITIAGTHNLAVTAFGAPQPPNYLSVAEEFGLFPTGGPLVLYERTTYENLLQVWPGIIGGTPQTPPTPNANWPQLWAMLPDNTLWFGPPVDGNYTAFFVGLYQPPPLTASNQTSYLSTFYPALLEAGIMIFLAGALRRNFGAQADEPRMAVSWEQQFLELLAPARDEEMRRRGMRPDVPAPRPEPARQ